LTVYFLGVYCQDGKTIAAPATHPESFRVPVSPKEVIFVSDTLTLKVEGMTCGHCKMAVEKAAKSVAGVSGAEVDLAAKEVKVSGSFAKGAVVAAIEDAGYDVVK